MFNQLTIKNFQSHANAVIDFCTGVNVIHGISTSGKTAILRAIRLLIDNRPLGGRYFSDFAGDSGDTYVEIVLSEGTKVSLNKKIRINKDKDKQVVSGMYAIDGQEYAANKDQLPDQVKQALNMSELNVQYQFDAPFLVASSPGEIARTINRITKLEKVDEWISKLTSQINQTNRDILGLEEEAKAGLAGLKKYEDIEDTGKLVAELNVICSEIATGGTRAVNLDNLLVQYEDTTVAYNKISDYLSVEKEIKSAEDLHLEIAKFDLLSSFVARVESLAEEIRTSLQHAKEFEKMLVLIDRSDYSILETRFAGLNSQLARFNILAEGLASDNDMLAKSKKVYSKKLRDVGKCPLCFSDIGDEQIKRVEAAL